ncbi:MAG: hypothetical protein JNM56_07560 [Planctomycetia bacterium]|nr:hypothetical protein [Planctomycetia bacterium]
MGLVQTWVEANGLKLHPTKTRIVEAATESFSFLGYEFRGRLRLPRPQSLAQLKDQVRPQTRRTSGDSLACIIARLNQTLRGWFEYFGHCSPTVYPDLDSWVRGRLRGLLRQRQGQPGRGRGADHQRWSNAYFAEPGLYSLSATHVRWCQSPSG